jgi:rare lipoprotein A
MNRILRSLLERRSGITAAFTGSLLAACATAPVTTPQQQSTVPPVAKSAPAPEAVKKKPVQKRGGGYYQDDGPDEVPPDNLDAVPDAEPRAEPLHRFANNPYNVFGIDYVPETEIKPYKARGVASWYGKKFHGQRTSSGEAYDMYGMTAAHPTLPIPSYARVTNLANGKSVVVRINDRGPFHSSRLIDLSYTAAYKLGYVNNGSTEVEVETIVPEGVELIAANVPPIKQRGSPARSKPSVSKTATPQAPDLKTPEADPVAAIAAAETPASAAPSPQGAPAVVAMADGGTAGATTSSSRSSALAAAASNIATHAIFLQLGAFNTARNAEGFRNMVEVELSWLADKLQVFASNGRFRLHAGPFSSDAEARLAASKIAAALQLKPFVVVR